MTHEITVSLTDEEYAALAIKAEETNDEIEALIHILRNRLRKRYILSTRNSSRSPEQQAVSEALYEAGLINHIPTGERLSEEEEAELKRLADFFGQAGGKPASEMVIEDRGPY